MLVMSKVPAAVDKTWTVTKSSTSLTITCNDVAVAHLVFDKVDKNKFPKCVTELSKKVTKIKFAKSGHVDMIREPLVVGNKFTFM